jgi:hypothetical protein
MKAAAASLLSVLETFTLEPLSRPPHGQRLVSYLPTPLGRSPSENGNGPGWKARAAKRGSSVSRARGYTARADSVAFIGYEGPVIAAQAAAGTLTPQASLRRT